MRQDLAPLACLTRKLARLAQLSPEDVDALGRLPCSTETVSLRHHLVREGCEPSDCCLLVSGFACRYKLSAAGFRQIVSFHMPGDLLDLQHLYLSIADHHVQTITPATVAWIPKQDLRALSQQRPAIADALWRDALIDASIFREWVLNVGRRDGKSRVAHMLCEFVARCETAGLGPAEGARWPMTQEQIADATGLTPVHVNRMLKALNADGVIERLRGGYWVKDWQGLKQAAAFDQTYLHAAAA
jgi:CRP-like cAMP-binding protein